MSDLIDSLREALTGWSPDKKEASGKGGDQRSQSIDDKVTEIVEGTPSKKNQSTDHQNGY